MFGFMNIRVQVMANQARRAIQQVDGDLSRLAVAQSAANASTGRGAVQQKAANQALQQYDRQMRRIETSSKALGVARKGLMSFATAAGEGSGLLGKLGGQAAITSGRLSVLGQKWKEAAGEKATARLTSNLDQVSGATDRSSRASGRHGFALRDQMRSMTSFGNQLQWTGRQLQYNWTLPILAATAAGVYFQMENEKAMTRLKKVYADPGFEHTTAELASLEKAFEALSETYGVAQADVVNIAADWAAAGSSGIALARQTELTMKTMVLGELEAAEATEALIAIQAQYNQNSIELTDTIARLNNVENQTGTKMKDLIVSMSKSAGVAREAGIDVAHLAAMTAALVPAAGTAAQAGNALKTIISRLLSPTGEASQILNEMGIATDDMAWKSANATTRIGLLADKYQTLSDSQQAVVSATLASRYQINKFEVLMDAIARKGNAAGDSMSYYWKALEAATDREQYLAQVTRELDAVLSSAPRRWEKIKAVMSNALANVVQPMLPAIMAIGGQIAMMTKRLSELHPATLKWIGVGLAMLVILPMMVRYVGSLITLFATFGRAFLFLTAPIGWAIGALVGLVKMLHLTTAAMWVLRTTWAVVMLGFGLFSAAIPAILTGFGALISGVWAISQAVFGITVLIPVLLTGMVGPVGKAMKTVWAMARFVTVVMWQSIMLTITTAMKAIPRLITVAGGAIIAATKALGTVLVAAWAATGAAIRALWMVLGAALIRAQMALGTALTAVTALFSRGIAMAFYTMGTLLPGIMTVIGVAIWKAWYAAMYGLAVITGPILQGIAFLVANWGRWMTALMYGIGAAIAFVWNVIWGGLTKLWAARTALISAITWTWGTVIVPMMATIGTMLVAALASPWTWVALAVVAILYGLRDKIKSLWNNVVEWFVGATDAVVDRVISAFNFLPEGIRNAIMAVVRIIRAAALQVYEWFSYLNPFARHSPSLVENVTRGMAEVARQFGTLTQIKGPIDSAYASIARFKSAMGALGDNLEFAGDRQIIGEINPAALGAFDNLVSTLTSVRARADQLNAAVKQQESVVKVWKQRLDAANESLEDQRDILNRLQDVADGYADQIADLNGEIDTLASTPLTGMGAMEDALFANEMAQKRLRLEMLKAGEQGGQSYDDIRNKISLLAGEMETLTGTREDLRSMGAGSEILDHYDAQIEALGAQKKALERAEAPVNEMQKQLEELQRQAEIMDLEKALAFDPLTRQIDQAANAMAEMPFDEIISKIRSNQIAVENLERAHAGATAAVEAQQAAVDRAQASVDAIQASYDAEAEKLEVIRDLYQEVADAVRDMEGALSDASGAANAVKQAQEGGGEGYVSPALQNFRDAAGGDFADVSGHGGVGRENKDILDQSGMIDQFTADLAQTAGEMFGSFDMWQPLRDMWNSFVKWWNKTIGPWITAAGDFFTHMFDGVDIFGGLEGKGEEVGAFFTTLWDGIVAVVSTVWDFGKMLWEFIGPDVKTTLDTIFGFFTDMWENLKTIFADAKEMAAPLVDALQNLWAIVKVPLYALFGYILWGVQIAWSVFNGVLGPVLDWVSGLFMNLWQVVKGVIDMFIGLFTLDFDRFFSGLGGALKGLWGIVWDTLVSLGDLILSAIGGLVSGIWDGMFYIGEMIWDGLDAGLNAIGLGWLTDIIGGIIDFVKDLFGIASPSTVFAEIGGWLMDGLVNGITTGATAVWDFFVALPGKILEGIGDAGSWLIEKGKDVLGGLISGIETKSEELLAWLLALPGKVTEWAGDTTQWLIEKGKGIIGGLITGVKEKAQEVITWFKDLPGKIETWIGDTITFLRDEGYDLITGFIQGIIDKVPEVIEWCQGLPGKIQEWIGDTVTYLKDNGMELIQGFIDGIIEHAPSIAKGIGIALLVVLAAMVAVPVMLIVMGIALIVGFVRGITSAISDWLGPKLEELKKFITDKFWAIIDWVTEKWNGMWTAIKTAAQTAITWVQEKFQAFKDKVSEIFQSIKDKVGEIWDGLLEKVKTPIRVVFTWVNGNMINPINSLLSKFPGNLKIPSLPALREGGLARGPGTGTSDSILGVNRRGVPTARVSDGEFVVNERSTRANFALINAINSAHGKLPAFRDGGFFGNIGNAASWAWDKAGNAASWVGEKVGDLVAKGGRFAAEQMLKPLRDAAKALIPGDGIFPTTLRGSVDKLYEAVTGKGDEHDKQMESLQGGTFPGTGKRTPNGIGGLGPQALAARNFVMRTFGISNIGGYAYRNIAGTTSLSDHATGHAIDVMIANYKTPAAIAKGNQVASYFVQNPNAFGTKYVIWRDQINQGRGWQAYGHPGGGRSDTLQHRDHVHVSVHDQGGILNGMGVNLTGRPERVLSPRQTLSFDRLVTILDRDGIPSMARMEAAIFRAQARANGAANIGSQTIIQHQGDNNVTININGDLSFPNITDGDDADVFLKNLGDLASGGRR